MKTRYYKYSKPGSKEKYTQITEAEYLVAKESPNRWFISFGDSVLECEEHQHKKHYNQKNHSDYINRDANGKKPVRLSFDEYKLETGMDITEVIEDTTVNVEDECYKKYQYELLYAALAQLDEDERRIILELFWNKRTQTALAKINGISKQTLNEKQRRILEKMLKLMKNKK